MIIVINILLLTSSTAVATYYNVYRFTESSYISYRDKILLVIDFGSSHVDVSVALIRKNSVEIIGSRGSGDISGDRINTNIVNYLLQKYRQKSGKNDLNDETALARLMKEVERVKRSLSDVEVATLYVESFHGGGDFVFTLTRDVFQKINQGQWTGIEALIKKLLEETSFEDSDIDDVIMAGGSTRIPAFKNLIRQMFKKSKILTTEEAPEMLAVLGAAVQGEILTQSSYLASKSVSDVTTSALKYRDETGKLSVVFPKFSTFPNISRIPFGPHKDNIGAVYLLLYEVSDKTQTPYEKDRWGRIAMDGIPEYSRNLPLTYTIIFKLNENGIFEFSLESPWVKHDSFKAIPVVRDLTSETDKIKARVQNLFLSAKSTRSEENCILHLEKYLHVLKKKLPDVAASIDFWLNNTEMRSLNDLVQKSTEVEKNLTELITWDFSEC